MRQLSRSLFRTLPSKLIRMTQASQFQIRQATLADIPALRELIERSVRELQKDDYTPERIEGAVLPVVRMVKSL